MALWSIVVEEGLQSKNASVTMKETSHPVLSKKLKRRKLKSVVMHCEKLSISQIRMLSTLCFYGLIDKIGNRKDFPSKIFHKKSFYGSLVK